ncbi:MAG TPA: hypothetical protein VGH74_17545 [Planctomycetaceae bacterium]
MRWLSKLVAAVLALLIFCGCQQADPSPPNMLHEILGALQIRDGKERDAALATACRESADQGSAPTVLMGIPKIEDVTLRDQVAEECAVSLDESGQAEAAVDVAKLISDESRRDRLLAKLRAGS